MADKVVPFPDAHDSKDVEFLRKALDLLEHYHLEHTRDLITRFRSPKGTEIYVVANPEWQRKLRDFMAPAFDPPRSGGCHDGQ